MRKFSPPEALEFLEEAVRVHVRNPLLQAACEIILDDERFRLGYGSAAEDGKHHAFAGGLLVHVAEVAHYCLRLDNSEELLTAVIFHDCAKIFDYDEFGNKTSYRTLIRHVSGSFALFSELLRGQIPQEQFERIGHCILAHHGRQAWGSPVEPQTAHAMILHHADMLSAYFGPGK